MQFILVFALMTLANIYVLEGGSDRHMAIQGLSTDDIQHEVKIEPLAEPQSLVEALN